MARCKHVVMADSDIPDYINEELTATLYTSGCDRVNRQHHVAAARCHSDRDYVVQPSQERRGKLEQARMQGHSSELACRPIFRCVFEVQRHIDPRQAAEAGLGFFAVCRVVDRGQTQVST